MKKVEKYEAIDGQIFDSEEECISYEKLIHLKKEYDGDYTYTDTEPFKIGGRVVDFYDIVFWAKNNKEFFKKIAAAL